jgi:hypothetical protein
LRNNARLSRTLALGDRADRQDHRRRRSALAPRRPPAPALGPSQPHRVPRCRLEEVTRRAAELRLEQAALGGLVAELGAEFDALPAAEQAGVLRALGVPESALDVEQDDGGGDGGGAPPMGGGAGLAAQMRRIGDTSGWAPPAAAKEELRRLADEADAMARRIEEGEDLPPMPREEVVAEPEPAAQFLARMRASVARFEARMGGGGGAKRADGAASKGGSPATAEESTSPGWQGPFSNVPVLPEELRGTRPAPDLPAAGRAEWRRVQRIAYVLRRAHLQEDPVAPVAALRQRKLLAEGASLEDPWARVEGAAAAQAHMGRVRDAGGRVELDSLFLTCTQFE